MGWLSRGKCPIHQVEYSIGSDGLERYYYCSKCRRKAINERDDKQALLKRIEELEKKLNS